MRVFGSVKTSRPHGVRAIKHCSSEAELEWFEATPR